MQERIFVFGSNEAGVHGAGAALAAVNKHGAILGIGYGPQGNSFAIPTKDKQIETLPIEKVRKYVLRFIEYAESFRNKKEFQVTAIGCGLAGFKHEQMAPLFVTSPSNCFFDEAWKLWLPKKHFWGTF